MKQFTREQQDLEDRREFLLLQIVKLKQNIRKKVLELGKQNDYLNRMANDITISCDDKLDLLSFKLKQMLKCL